MCDKIQRNNVEQNAPIMRQNSSQNRIKDQTGSQSSGCFYKNKYKWLPLAILFIQHMLHSEDILELQGL